MIRISEILHDILKENMFLQFGMNNGLFNLTKLAQYLKPYIEARAKKEVTESALLMNLSRFQKKHIKITPNFDQFTIEKITIHGGLCTRTYFKNDTVHKSIYNLYNAIQKNQGYVTLSEGISEITIITHDDYLERMNREIDDEPKSEFKDISAIVVKFHPKYVDQPGMLFFLIQQITMQNINIIEISSTFTELIFYIEKKNTKLAFETIEHCFA